MNRKANRGFDKNTCLLYNSICGEMRNNTLRDAQKVLKALSDRSRLRILKMLETRPMAVCEVREVLGLSMSTISKHLAILREAGFILDDKDGRWIEYRLNDEKLPVIESLLEHLSRWVEEDPLVLSDRERSVAAKRFEICRKGKNSLRRYVI
jgi:ArsR family transcriptional regulator